jgi:hypothetical protein
MSNIAARGKKSKTGRSHSEPDKTSDVTLHRLISRIAGIGAAARSIPPIDTVEDSTSFKTVHSGPVKVL